MSRDLPQDLENNIFLNSDAKKRIAFVADRQAVTERAREIATERVKEKYQQETQNAGFFKKLWKGIKHTVRGEYERQREIGRARHEIERAGHFYVDRPGVDKTAYDATMRSVIERFTSDYESEAIHTDENKQVNNNPELKAVIRGLIRDYANPSGGIPDKAAFDAEMQTRFQGIPNLSPEMASSAVGYANNVFEVAEQAKAAVRHGVALENLDLEFDLIIGEARTGVRTDNKFNSVDRAVDWMKSHRAFSWVDENTLGVATAVFYTAGQILSKRVIGSKAAQLVTFGATGAVGGAFAAAKENMRLKEERAMLSRHMAQNKEIPLNAQGLKEMERFVHEMKKSADIITVIQTQLYKNPNVKKPEFKDNLSQAEFESLVKELADLESRIILSDTQKIDLVQYSDITLVDQERTKLDLLRAIAKTHLRQVLSQPGNSISLPNNVSFDSYLGEAIRNRRRELTEVGSESIQAKDRAFNKMKRRKVAWKFVKVLGISLAGGTVLQQGIAWGKDLWHWGAGTPNTRIDTIGEKAWHGIRGVFGKDSVYSGAMHDSGPIGLVAGVETTAHIPAGTQLVQDGDHWNLVDDHGKHVFDGIKFDDHGNIDAHSADELRRAGFDIADHTHTVNHDMKADDYWKSRLGEHKRADWHHKGPQYSSWFKRVIEHPGKEQMQYLRKDDSGQVYLDMKPVMKNLIANAKGFFKEFGTNPDMSKDPQLEHLYTVFKDCMKQPDPDAAFGKLFQAAIIPTDYANSKGLSELIDGAGPDGRVYLPPDISKLFTTAAHLKDGHLPFRFMEFRFMGHVFNTTQGPEPGLMTVPVEVHDPTILPPEGHDYEVPNAIPFDSRKPLEPTVYRPFPARESEPIPGYYNYGGVSERDREMFNRMKSERLRDPDAQLDHYEEIEDYFEKQDSAYKRTLETLVQQTQPMNPECKLAVCIPVAGHQEGQNIYRTLENYANQKAPKNSFELVLFVNHPRSQTADSTLSEITRFKSDYPEMNVCVMYQALPDEQAKIGYIRKLLNDTVLYRHHRRGRRAGDLILVSNDADNKGLAKTYVENFLVKFQENPKVDAFLGQLDWDPESYLNNPLVHVGTRFYQYLDTQARRRGWSINSSGANYAFRSSIYAGVGGYLADRPGAEDVVLGSAIRNARAGSSDPERRPVAYAGTRVSRLYTSSRRAIDAVENGLAPIEQWSKGFGAYDSEVRRIDVGEAKDIDFNNHEQVNAFVKQCEVMINRSIAQYRAWGIERDLDEFIAKPLGLLGIKYETTEPDTIRITDASRLVAYLAKYKQEAGKLRGANARVRQNVKVTRR